MTIIPEKWINEPDENNDGLLEVSVAGGEAGFPMPVETHNVNTGDVTLGAPQEFGFVFEAASGVHIYKDEDDYNKNHEGHLASESVIPCGLFSPNGDENFVPSGKAIISGRVTVTYDNPIEMGFAPDDVIFSMTCLGHEFDMVVPSQVAPIGEIEIGNIVSGTYWIQGWPEEDNCYED